MKQALSFAPAFSDAHGPMAIRWRQNLLRCHSKWPPTCKTWKRGTLLEIKHHSQTRSQNIKSMNKLPLLPGTLFTWEDPLAACASGGIQNVLLAAGWTESTMRCLFVIPWFRLILLFRQVAVPFLGAAYNLQVMEHPRVDLITIHSFANDKSYLSNVQREPIKSNIATNS